MPSAAPGCPSPRSSGVGSDRLLVGVVAGADERPRFDVLEAERLAVCLELGELVRMPVADERVVLERWAQVLTDRDDLDVVGAHLIEQLLDLVHLLPEPDHEARL